MTYRERIDRVFTRMRDASRASACLVVLELGIATFVGALVELPVARAGSALLDPSRVGAALVELDAKSRAALLPEATIVVATFLLYLAVEPLLTIAFIRAHTNVLERHSIGVRHRWAGLALFGARVVVLVALGIGLGLLAAAGTFAHLATRHASDPRVHDLPLVLLALGGLGWVALGYVTTELATISLALGRPNPLEAVIDAGRGIRPRFVVIRYALAIASLGVAVASIALTDRASDATGLGSMLASFLVVALATAARVALRSSWLGYMVDTYGAGEP